jgi:hypothetical protein
MAEENFKDELATIVVEFNVPESVLNDFTVGEVVMMESLLTPGLQTSIKVHSYLHNIPKKDLDLFKNSIATIKINRPILKRYGLPDEMKFSQRIYRMANRKLVNNNNEEYVLHACDDSLLTNAKSLVSQQWNCIPPHNVVSEVLSRCAKVKNMEIESTSPGRDYIAENIHPFEVVKQQADVALSSSGSDPSFVHFMTYENNGTHHFKSLYKMTRENHIIELAYSEASGAKNGERSQESGYRNPYGIMQYSFPCDFDLLSDLLNGVDENGNDITSIVTINPLLGQFSLLGGQTMDCGIGNGVYKVGMSNKNSEQQQSSCNIGIEDYMLKRQARMNLLEQDKIALRLTVPWCPIYHAGKVIRINLYNKNDNKIKLYGSGDYLISSMIHTVKRGGFSTTTMDCVSTTVGKGIQ